MRPLRVMAVLLCASTLAVAAVGCGGGGGTKSTGTKRNTWAANVCGAMTEWGLGLQADSKNLAKGNPNLQTRKTRLVALLEKTVRRADTMIAKVKAAGPPAVKNGPKLQAELVIGLRRTRKSVHDAVPQAKALPTTNRNAFSKGVVVLGAGIDKELAAIGREFKRIGVKYRNKDLNKAISREPACKSLLA